MMIGDRPGEWQPLNPPRSMLGMIALPSVVFLTLWVSIFVLPAFGGRVPPAGAPVGLFGGHPPPPGSAPWPGTPLWTGSAPWSGSALALVSAHAWGAAAVVLTCWWWTSAACCTIILTVVAKLRSAWVPPRLHGPITSFGCGWIALSAAVPAFTVYVVDVVVTRNGVFPVRDTIVLFAVGVGVALMLLGGVQMLERRRSRPEPGGA